MVTMRKETLLYTIILFSFLLLQNNSLLKTDNSDLIAKRNLILYENYFPLNEKKVLIYKSDFGQTELTIQKDKDVFVSEFKSDDFIYRQKVIPGNNGIFVKETYQKIKVLLFINKESSFSYNEPLPRFKFPMEVGHNWSWTGTEYNNKERNSLKVESSVIGEENIKVSAGQFQTIKVITEIESDSGTRNKVTEWLAKDIGIVKSEIEIQGGGLMGFIRDVLGYGKISFELTEIKSKY